MMYIDYSIVIIGFGTILPLVIVDLLLVANKSITKRTGELLFGLEFLMIAFILLGGIYMKFAPPTFPFITFTCFIVGSGIAAFFAYQKQTWDNV